MRYIWREKSVDYIFTFSKRKRMYLLWNYFRAYLVFHMEGQIYLIYQVSGISIDSDN